MGILKPFIFVTAAAIAGCARIRTNRRVVLGVLYCGEEQHLSRKLSEWQKWRKEVSDRYAMFVIDDGCKGKKAEEIMRAAGTADLRVEMFTVLRDIPWNIGGARNLLMTVAGEHHAVLLTDMDLEISEDLANAVADFAATMDQATVVIDFDRVFEDRSQAHKIHPAVMLISPSTYWRVGGCDEDFARNILRGTFLPIKRNAFYSSETDSHSCIFLCISMTGRQLWLHRRAF